MYEAVLSAVGFWAAECVGPPLPPLELVRHLPTAKRAEEALAEIARWSESLERYDAAGKKLPWRVGGAQLRLNWHFWAWFQVRTARAECNTDQERRLALRGLIDYWGWRTVLSGQYPPPVPIEWHATTRAP